MRTDLKAIDTAYKGYLFRSRLEARWAVYFDAIGIRWDYEIEGFDLEGTWYLPDFWLPQVRMWAEVKPEEFSADELKKVRLLAKHAGRPCILLVGVPDTKPYLFVEHYQFEEELPDGTLLREEEMICDCILSTSYLHERRFFMGTGACGDKDYFLKYYPGDAKELWPAVQAARSARFEHDNKR